jgi:hypothetical protein
MSIEFPGKQFDSVARTRKNVSQGRNKWSELHPATLIKG